MTLPAYDGMLAADRAVHERHAGVISPADRQLVDQRELSAVGRHEHVSGHPFGL
jgi:hypothetical protein